MGVATVSVCVLAKQTLSHVGHGILRQILQQLVRAQLAQKVVLCALLAIVSAVVAASVRVLAKQTLGHVGDWVLGQVSNQLVWAQLTERVAHVVLVLNVSCRSRKGRESISMGVNIARTENMCLEGTCCLAGLKLTISSETKREHVSNSTEDIVQHLESASRQLAECFKWARVAGATSAQKTRQEATSLLLSLAELILHLRWKILCIVGRRVQTVTIGHRRRRLIVCVEAAD